MNITIEAKIDKEVKQAVKEEVRTMPLVRLIKETIQVETDRHFARMGTTIKTLATRIEGLRKAIKAIKKEKGQ